MSIYALASSDTIRSQPATEPFREQLAQRRLAPDFLDGGERYMAEFGAAAQNDAIIQRLKFPDIPIQETRT